MDSVDVGLVIAFTPIEVMQSIIFKGRVASSCQEDKKVSLQPTYYMIRLGIDARGNMIIGY